jgi:hypothetical protein
MRPVLLTRSSKTHASTKGGVKAKGAKAKGAKEAGSIEDAVTFVREARGHAPGDNAQQLVQQGQQQQQQQQGQGKDQQQGQKRVEPVERVERVELKFVRRQMKLGGGHTGHNSRRLSKRYRLSSADNGSAGNVSNENGSAGNGTTDR